VWYDLLVVSNQSTANATICYRIRLTVTLSYKIDHQIKNSSDKKTLQVHNYFKVSLSTCVILKQVTKNKLSFCDKIFAMKQYFLLVVLFIRTINY
jgi:hypothetical protein